MTTYSITGPDGKVYSIDGPAGATQEQVVAQIQAAQRASAPAGAVAPAPRWDVMGDIGRAASSAAGALKEDFTKAGGATEKGADLGLLATLGRMGHALKVPLDALAVAASPVTGLLHGTLGSAASYAIAPMAHDMGRDPKVDADNLVDTAMQGIGPGGMEAGPVALAAEGTARQAAAAAKAQAAIKAKALAKVAQRAADDGLTAQDVLNAQKTANAGGDKITLMDLGDKNVRGLAGAVYRAPGPAGKALNTFLEDRDAASGEALRGDVQGSVAKGSTYSAEQALLKSRSAAARPAYDEAGNVGQVWSPRLQQFLDHSEVQSGLKSGLKLEQQDSIAENRPFVPEEFGITGFNEAGDPIVSGKPTMKAMMVAKEGLDARIAELKDPNTGRPTKAGLSLKKFRDAFVAELDKINPKYKPARDVWSGPSQSMEAMRDGRQHFTRTESNEQLKAEFDDLSPGDKEFYRLGAAEAKIDAVERAPDASDKSKRVINTDRDRKRFRKLFDSDAEANKFMATVARKRTMFETRGAVKGNSATAGRLAEDADANASMALEGARGAAHAASGNWLGAAAAAYRLKRDLGLRNNPELNSEIAKILTDHDLAAGGNGQNVFAPISVPEVNNYFSRKAANVNTLATLGRGTDRPPAKKAKH